MRRLPHRAGAAFATIFLFTTVQVPEANAHLVTTGLGPFYDGLAHVLFAPEDAIAVLVIALLAGRSGIAIGRAVLFTLPVAWCVGALLGLHAPVTQLPTWFTVVTFMGLGGLIVVNYRLSAPLAVTLSLMLGLTHGYFNGCGLATTVSVPFVLAGILASMFVGVALVAAVVASLRAPWMGIAVRTLGSWITAGGLLALGWTLRGLT
ncbi:HupE / UreJ protein [Rhizobiales bacterium GAS113]|nr:HupE / UreJ protein [Rhizobiales bacterium GAS113]